MIYFDNAATTRPDNEAVEFAQKFLTDDFYNPSALYNGGIEVSKQLKSCRETIKKHLGADDYEVIFTASGTESDNMAIFGCVKRGTFITDLGEHSAVYKSFCELKNRGHNVEFMPLNVDGSVNVEKLLEYVSNNRVDFVSIVHVNNETGAINDVNYIAKEIKKINPKIIFHSDGVQAFGKLKFKLCKEIDLYSISAHKINAIKGTGALLKRKNVNLTPIIFGGGQENNYRSGTENVFGIKAFEYSINKKYNNINENYIKVAEIKEFIVKNLNNDVFTVISGENSSPYILTVSAKGLRGEVLMHMLENYGIIVGNGSACSSKNRYSRVIGACGYSNDILDGIVRISFSSESSLNEAQKFVNIFNEQGQKLKGIV